MKNKKILYIMLIVLIVPIYFLYEHIDNKKHEVKRSETVEIKAKNKELSILFETDVNSGEYVEQVNNTWPDDDYIVNADLTKCLNGSKVVFDKETKEVKIESTKTDKCYIYFQKYNYVTIDDVDYSFPNTTSIKVDVEATRGTEAIDTYYYSIDNASWVQDNASHTFTGLSSNTEYNIRVKVKDANGIYSSISDDDITLAYSITCNAGEYLSASSDTCSTCPAGSYCSGGTYTYDGNAQGSVACSTLGSNYTSSSGASATSDCYIAVPAGSYKTSANGNETTGCGAGKYSTAHNSAYGVADTSCANISAGCYGTSGTSACPNSCTGRTQYCPGATANYSTVSSGYYSTGCTGNNNCTGQSQCGANTYCTSGVQYNCPSGQTSSAGSTSSSACTTPGCTYYLNQSNPCSGTAVCTNGKITSFSSCNASYSTQGGGCSMNLSSDKTLCSYGDSGGGSRYWRIGDTCSCS